MALGDATHTAQKRARWTRVAFPIALLQCAHLVAGDEAVNRRILSQAARAGLAANKHLAIPTRHRRHASGAGG